MRYKSLLIIVLIAILGSCQKEDEGGENESGEFHRTVLIELFTNVYCENCPMADAFADSMVDMGKAVAIKYHSPLYNPLDPFSGLPAGDEIRNREGFYFGSSTHGYPYTIFDGVMENEGIRDIEGWENQLDSRIAIGSNVKIELNGHRGEFTGELNIALDGSYSGKTLRIALVESGLEFEGETYNFVLRRFLPDANGIPLTAKSDTIAVPFEIQPDWTAENIAFVVFVQDDATREVEQAAMIEWRQLAQDTASTGGRPELISQDTLFLTTHGNMVYVPMWLKNVGYEPDSFQVVVSGELPGGWFKTLCVGPVCLPDSIGWTSMLAPDDSIDITVEVYAATVDSTELTVRATAKSSPTAADSAKIRIVAQ